MVHYFLPHGGCTLAQVLHGSATTTEAIRRAIQRSQESLRILAKPTAQSKDRSQMAQAQLRRRSADRPETAELNRAVGRGGGDCRLPSAHLTAARRLPVCAASDDPASDPIIVASLSEAARHLAPAAC